MLIVLPRLLYGFVIIGALLVIAMLWRPIRAGDRTAQLLALGAAAVMPASAAFLLHGVERSFAPMGLLPGWPLTDWPVLFFVTVLSHLGLEELRHRTVLRSRFLHWLGARPHWLYVPALVLAPDFYSRYLAGSGELIVAPGPYAASLSLVGAVLVISFSMGLWSRLRSRYHSAQVLFHSILGLIALCIVLGVSLGWAAATHPQAALSQLLKVAASPLIETAMLLIVLRGIDAAGLKPVEELKERLGLPPLSLTGLGALSAIGAGAFVGQLAAEPWDSVLAALTPLVCLGGMAGWLAVRREAARERRNRGAPDDSRRAPEPGGLVLPFSVEALGGIAALSALTPRQLEAVQMVTQGLSNAEIAEEMVITEGTVKKHLSRIYEKVDVGSRTELIALIMGSAAKSAEAG